MYMRMSVISTAGLYFVPPPFPPPLIHPQLLSEPLLHALLLVRSDPGPGPGPVPWPCPFCLCPVSRSPTIGMILKNAVQW